MVKFIKIVLLSYQIKLLIELIEQRKDYLHKLYYDGKIDIEQLVEKDNNCNSIKSILKVGLLYE